ncbi:MAG: right-handed parallel beta-helix repeat-containing protein [Thermoplasmatota archaeon]
MIHTRRIAVAAIIWGLLFSAFGAMMVFTEEVSGTNLIVGPGQTYTTIQGAINAASTGDVIRVYDGTYEEKITVGKSISIIGNGSAKTKIKGDGSGNLVTVTTSNVKIGQISISTGTTSGSYAAVYAGTGISNLKIENCNFSTSYYGLRIYASSSSHSSRVKVQNCSFYNNYYHLYTYYNDYNLIRNNSFILGDYYSIYYYYSMNGIIENNSFYENDYGLRIYYSNYNWVGNNTITKTEDSYGLDLYYANYNRVWNNTVDRTLNSYGVYYYNSDYNYFEWNKVLNSGTDGIYLSGSDYNQIKNNTVQGSDEDALYHSSGTYNNFWDNSFKGSGYYLTSTTTTYWSTNTYINNEVNGRKLYVWYQVSNRAVSNAGQVLLHTCTNINVTNQNLSNASIGVVMVYSSGCWIRNNTMNDNYNGIYVYGSSSAAYYNNIIRNNTIRRTDSYGMYLYYMDRMKVEKNIISHTSSYGIYHYYSDYNEITDNVISDTGSYSLYYYYSTNSLIDGNEIMRTSNYGIYSYYSTDTRIWNNEIHNTSSYGLYIYASSSATAAPTNLRVQNNTFTDTTSYSIYISYGKNCLMRDNEIKKSRTSGIYLSNADLNDINNNTFRDCRDAGLMIASGADSNNIRDNTFLGCGLDFSTTTAAQWTGNSVAATNTVNGKQIYLRTSTNNLVVPSTVGQVFLYDCDYAVISGATLNNATTGVFLNYCDYATIQNNMISNGTYGLQIMYSDHTRIYNNTIKKFRDYGIYDYYADYTHTYNNTISDTGYPYDPIGSYGVYYYYSTDSYTENNTLKNCGVVLYTPSSTSTYWNTHRFSNNTVNGKDLKVFKSASGQTVNGNAGQVLILNSNNITVKNCDLSRSSIGIAMMNSVDITIENVTADHNYYGIFVYGAYGKVDRTSIKDCDVSSAGYNGIRIYSSSTASYTAHDIEIINVNASNCGDDGMYLYYCGENWRIENNIVDNNADDYGIYFYATSSKIPRNLVLRNNSINRNHYGAYIYYADYSYIENNSASYNTYYGIYAYYCDFAKIERNTANNNVMYGIYAYYADGCILNNNKASNNKADGIYAYYCDPTTISNNTANGNAEDGIYAYYCTLGLDIKYNSAMGNGFSGIEVYYQGKGGLIGNNASQNNLHGLHIRAGDYNARDNYLYNNKGYGIKLEGTYAINNLFTRNHFTGNNGNKEQAYDDVGKNQWDDGKYGNFWSDLSSPDANSDGIIEVRYNIPGPAGASDRYPLVSGVPIIIPPTNLAAVEDSYYSATFDHFGVDPPVSWSYTTNAAWMNTGNSPTISGTPTNDHVGSWWVRATATKGTGSTSRNLTIIVSNTNDDPVMDPQNNLYTDEDALFWHVFGAVDVDPSETLKYALHTNAGFLSIDTSTGNVSGIPRNADIGSYFVEVTVSDSASATDSVNVTLTVNNTNDAPVITTVDVNSVYMTVAYSVDYDATDEDPTGDVLTWHLTTNASFLSIVSGTGVVSGTPVRADIGTYWVNVSVDDGNGGLDWSNFTLTVNQLNTAPLITTADVTSAQEDSLYSVDYNANDPDSGDILTWYLKTNASFLSINSATGLLSGTPKNDHIGAYWVNVSVDDGSGGTDWTNFTLVVNNVNDDPSITTTDVTSTLEDSAYNVTYQATDIDPTKDSLSWSLNTDADFLKIDKVNGWLAGTPDDSDIGLWWVNVSVEDGRGGADWSNFTLRVLNINDPPVITNSPWTNATEDHYYYFAMEFRDDDPASIGEVHTWSLQSAPNWISIDSATGELMGTPTNDHVGIWYFNILLDDGTSGTRLDISIEVVNIPPLIDPVPTMLYVNEDSMFYYNLTASDLNSTGEVFIWTLIDTPPWLDIDPDTGELSGIPINSHVGVRSVNVSVRDTNFGTDRVWFNITVNNTNDDPVIFLASLPDATEDELWYFILRANDVDPTDDILTWDILNTNAEFLSIDPATGNLSGTPDNGDVGDWWVVVHVSDGVGGSDELNLSLTVINVNDMPEILTDSIPDVIEDVEYWTILKGTDIDPTNDSLIWSIFDTNAEFLLMDTTTGNLSGFATNELVGIYWVVIALSDGRGGTTTVNLTFSVNNTNDDPVIVTMSLGEAREDELFFKILEGTDVDPTSDMLTWSIWTEALFLSIDPLTGNLSGTPANDDAGTWWILINLSDGRGGFDTLNLSLYVEGVNDGPELNITSLTLTIDEDGSITLDLNNVFIDIEGDSLSFGHLESENLTVSIIFGIATITPRSNWAGEDKVLFSASDGEYSKSIEVGIMVENSNDAPYDLQITAELRYIEGGDQWVSASARDPDLDYGDVLTYTWSSNISGDIGEGASINLSLGPGKHLITLRVTDSGGAFAERTFEVEILPKEEEEPTEPEEGGIPIWAWGIIAVVILIIIFLVIFVLIRRRKHEEGNVPDGTAQAPIYEQVETPPMEPGYGFEAFMPQEEAPTAPQDQSIVMEGSLEVEGTISLEKVEQQPQWEPSSAYLEPQAPVMGEPQIEEGAYQEPQPPAAEEPPTSGVSQETGANNETIQPPAPPRVEEPKVPAIPKPPEMPF